MAIGSYPRVTVQGTGPSQNPQNGQGLMLLNPSTGQYEAATSATFGGGGGGGDATAANQSTQITEAQTTNSYLFDGSSGSSAAEILTQSNNTLASISVNVATAANQTTGNGYLIAYGTSAAEYLNNIQNNTSGLATSSNQTNQQTTLNDILTKLSDIYNLLNNGTAKVQLYDGSGSPIGTTAGRLNVDAGA